MQIHNYNPDTREYTHSADARLDPLESQAQGKDVFLIPAYATDTAPKAAPSGHVRCFIDGTWSFVEDNRGKVIYSTADATAFTMGILGPVPAGYTLLVPCEYPKWEGGIWVVDTVKKAAAENAVVIASLAEIDAKSIRSLRELASQIDAGMADLEAATTIAGVKAALKKMLAVNEYIKNAESQAQTERAKIK